MECQQPQMPRCSDPRKSAFIRGYFCTLSRALSVAVMVALSFHATFAQSSVRDYRRSHERQILDEFTRLLAIPNIASDRENIRKNAQFILEMMQRRGLNPQLLEGRTNDTPPAVYAEWKTPGAMHSIVLYAHYDGQPVDPKAWTASPPFQPTWRSAAMESGGSVVTLPATGEINPEWRLYARAASDDKAGVMAILTAFDALRAQHIAPSLNIKFIFEGEEEGGRRISETSSIYTKTCSPPTRGSSATARYINRDASKWSLACAAIRMLTSRSMAQSGRCTAGITATGRRTRRWFWCDCSHR